MQKKTYRNVFCALLYIIKWGWKYKGRFNLCCRVWQRARDMHARSRSRYVSQHSTVPLRLDGVAMPWPARLTSAGARIGHQSFEETLDKQRNSSSSGQHNSASLYKFSFSTSVDVVHLWRESVLKFTAHKRYRCFKISSTLISNYFCPCDTIHE